MRTINAALTTHYALGATTLATALKITREDGTVFGYTSHHVDASISSVTYSATPGLDIKGIEVAASLAVGNLKLTTLNDGTIFTATDLHNGVWNNAAFIIFRYNHVTPSDGTDVQLVGNIGEVGINNGFLEFELRDIRQNMQQSVEVKSSKTCRARLGDSMCGVPLTGSPTNYTFTGTVTHVTAGNQTFRDSTRTQAEGWFDEGEITFTSGNNAGVSRKIKSFNYQVSPLNGTFVLALPLFGTVQVGDAYTAITGCRKRREEDCRDKFSNTINFQGEPDRKGLDNITQSPI